VAYALSDEMKIIDLGWPSRSVTTSTVGPTLVTAGPLVFISGVWTLWCAGVYVEDAGHGKECWWHCCKEYWSVAVLPHWKSSAEQVVEWWWWHHGSSSPASKSEFLCLVFLPQRYVYWLCFLYVYYHVQMKYSFVLRHFVLCFSVFIVICYNFLHLLIWCFNAAVV